MKTTKLLLLFLAFTTISLTSCKNDEPEPTKTELLTDGVWITKKAEYYEDGNLTDVNIATDIITINFKDDHSGVTKRNGDTEFIWAWQFNSSKTRLTVTYDDGTESYDIDKLNDSKLELSFTETEDGVLYKNITYLEK